MNITLLKELGIEESVVAINISLLTERSKCAENYGQRRQSFTLHFWSLSDFYD